MADSHRTERSVETFLDVWGAGRAFEIHIPTIETDPNVTYLFVDPYFTTPMGMEIDKGWIIIESDSAHPICINEYALSREVMVALYSLRNCPHPTIPLLPLPLSDKLSSFIEAHIVEGMHSLPARVFVCLADPQPYFEEKRN